MDIQGMKHVDRFLGIPLCALLRAERFLRSDRVPSPRGGLERVASLAASPARIGVIKFWGMGSLILAAPVFSALRRSFPKAELHLITLSPNRGILELLQLADHIHGLELSPHPAILAGKISAFLARLSRLHLDAVLDLEYLTRFSAVTAYLTAAPIRVGFHSWDVWRGNLHTHYRAFNPYWHVTDNFLNLCRALVPDEIEGEPVRLHLTGEEDKEARAILSAAGVAETERIIAVNPNASTMALARRWPPQYFIELINRLVKEGRGRVVLLGAPAEAEYVENLKARTAQPDAVVSLAGKSSLRGLVGVLRRAALLITNDSGPLHLADALGTRTVSFFGPETPSLYGPRGPGHVVLYHGIDCSPCINIYNAKTVRCMRPQPECLSGISVDEAWAAVERALEAAG